jgi:hypothetical protein
MSSPQAIKQRAKAFERVVAATWGATRMPLSGMNSKHGPGDVLLPTDVDALLECRTRVNPAHWTMWLGVVADAVKNKIDPRRAVLYLKKVGAKGHIVTLDGSMFAKIISIPEVKALFKKGSALDTPVSEM